MIEAAAAVSAYPTSSNVLSDLATAIITIGGVVGFIFRNINQKVLKPLEQQKDDLKEHLVQDNDHFERIHNELGATRKDLRKLIRRLERYEQAAEIERVLQVRERQRVADRDSYNHALEREHTNG